MLGWGLCLTSLVSICAAAFAKQGRLVEVNVSVDASWLYVYEYMSNLYHQLDTKVSTII